MQSSRSLRKKPRAARKVGLLRISSDEQLEALQRAEREFQQESAYAEAVASIPRMNAPGARVSL